MTEFQKLLDFDPLAAAEGLTGSSYKTDDATMRLGLGMHLRSVQSKRQELELRDDTHYMTKFADTLRIYADEGFEIVHSHEIEGTPNVFKVLWNPEGVLASVESYSWSSSDTELTTNTSRLHFNWKYNEETSPWSIPMSGGVTDDVWIGDIDAREALRHYLNRFRTEGTFLPVWIKRPHLWLIDYIQGKSFPENWEERISFYDTTTQSVIDSLPDHVREAITP